MQNSKNLPPLEPILLYWLQEVSVLTVQRFAHTRRRGSLRSVVGEARRWSIVPHNMEVALAAGEPVVVQNKSGVVVRSGVCKNTPVVCELPHGARCAVSGYAVDAAGTVTCDRVAQRLCPAVFVVCV